MSFFNRLWVRLSLLIISIVIMMIFLPRLFFFTRSNGIFDQFPELAEQFRSGAFSQLELEIEENIRRLVTYVLAVGGSAGVIVGVLFSRTLTRPLDKLKEAALAIQAKDYDTRVPEEGSQELVAVAKAFNSMATQLEKGEELRRNLLSDVAHELRHPLHIINGNIEAMVDGVYPMDAEGLERIRNQAGLLTRLINDLHELAQVEAEQIVLNKRHIHIGELVEQAVDSFQPEALGKRIKLNVELLGKLPNLLLDRERINQVLFNLLSNAIRYTPENGQIRVAVEQAGGLVEIRVEDSGVGIHPDALPHVFNRFYRSDKARSREHSGSGLGLAIVKALIQAHGGNVSVESDGMGHGSVFTIQLSV